MQKKTIQIVLAWADNTGLKPTGRMIQRDLNWFPEFRPCLEGKAAMWLGKGTEADISAAKAYAAKDELQVYTFPSSEKDPLGKARAAAVAGNHLRK